MAKWATDFVQFAIFFFSADALLKFWITHDPCLCARIKTQNVNLVNNVEKSDVVKTELFWNIPEKNNSFNKCRILLFLRRIISHTFRICKAFDLEWKRTPHSFLSHFSFTPVCNYLVKDLTQIRMFKDTHSSHSHSTK